MSGKENSLTETWLMIQKVRACCSPLPAPPPPPPPVTQKSFLRAVYLFILEINISRSIWKDEKIAFTTAKQTGKGNKLIKLILLPWLTLLHFRYSCTCGTRMSCTEAKPLQHLTQAMATGIFTFGPLEIQGFPHSSHLLTSSSLVCVHWWYQERECCCGDRWFSL